MSPSNQREEALFAALAGRNSAERATFLNGLCQRDAPLRRRLEALLAAHDDKNSLPDPYAVEAGTGSEPSARHALPTIEIGPADEAPDEAVGQSIGRYKLLEK